MITTWYLQSQRTWDKLCHSCIGSSFLPRGAFPEGRAYAFPQRLHAGSLEALRVSRPEAVVLAFNNARGNRRSDWGRNLCFAHRHAIQNRGPSLYYLPEILWRNKGDSSLLWASGDHI